MKKVLLFACVVFALSSCMTTRYVINPEYALSSIDNGKVEADADGGSSYSCDDFDITLTYGEKAIGIDLVNKSSSSIKVLWDDAAYIDAVSQTHRIIHTGIKIIDRDKAQVPSIVPKSARLTDEVVPVDCVEWSDGTKYTASGWHYKSLVSMTEFKTRIEAEDAVSRMTDVLLLLPMEIGGKKVEYTFKFSSDNKEVEMVKVQDVKKSLQLTTGITLSTVLLLLLVGAAQGA